MAEATPLLEASAAAAQRRRRLVRLGGAAALVALAGGLAYVETGAAAPRPTAALESTTEAAAATPHEGVDHAAAVLKAAYEPRQFVADVVVDAYGADIECSLFDDDAWYPDESAYDPTSTTCFYKDVTTQCSKHIWPSSPEYLERYSAACGRACPTEAEVEANPDRILPAYSDLCAWQGIVRMEDVCAGTFAPEAPALGESKNLDPKSLTGQVDFMEADRGGCGAHSFCATCYDDNGDLSSNCAKVLDHYESYVTSHSDVSAGDLFNGAVAASTSSVAMLFWADIDYWCGTLYGSKYAA